MSGWIPVQHRRTTEDDFDDFVREEQEKEDAHFDAILARETVETAYLERSYTMYCLETQASAMDEGEYNDQ